ncbi:hypothetical protein [Lactobacillus sp. LL6]|uniref:hypothetical protein n=1 Tax=Lactobacillus sp. LL6 TaxID=2596827 RepID=UPI0011864A82|nr:hypothetical protein [Lactobacillus sp. LL6]TSO26717.1 hypothetical protein FOD82_06545 [Lactobacillus sp. LL6]
MNKMYVVQEIDYDGEEFPLIQLFKSHEKAVEYFEARKETLKSMYEIMRDFGRNDNELATMFQKNEKEVNYLMKLTVEKVRD